MSIEATSIKVGGAVMQIIKRVLAQRGDKFYGEIPLIIQFQNGILTVIKETGYEQTHKYNVDGEEIIEKKLDNNKKNA